MRGKGNTCQCARDFKIYISQTVQIHKTKSIFRLSTDINCTTTCSANNFTRYTNGGGERGGSGDGGGGDPVEEEPALPVQLGVLGRLNLLVQLRGFDIGKWDSVNVD